MASTLKSSSPAPGQEQTEFDLMREYQALVEGSIKSIAGKDKKLRETMKRAMVMSSLPAEAAADSRQFSVEEVSLALTKTTDECFELMCRQELLWFMKYTDISRGRQADFDEAEARYQKQLQDSDTRWQGQNDAWKTETAELQSRIAQLEGQLRELGLDLPPAVTLPAAAGVDDYAEVVGEDALDVDSASSTEAEFEGLAKAHNRSSSLMGVGSPTPFGGSGGGGAGQGGAGGDGAKVAGSSHALQSHGSGVDSLHHHRSREQSTASLQDARSGGTSPSMPHGEHAPATATMGSLGDDGEQQQQQPATPTRGQPHSAESSERPGSGASSPVHTGSRSSLAPARKGSALSRPSPPSARRASLPKANPGTGGGRHARRDSTDRRSSALSDHNLPSSADAGAERLQPSPAPQARSASIIDSGLKGINSEDNSAEEFEDVGL